MKIYSKENQAERAGWIKTSEKIEVTFNGWDGKSYDGETRKMNVWVSPMHKDKKFVYMRVGGFESWDGTKYKIDAIFEVTDTMVVEKATGIAHPEAEYFWSEDVPYTVC